MDDIPLGEELPRQVNGHSKGLRQECAQLGSQHHCSGNTAGPARPIDRDGILEQGSILVASRGICSQVNKITVASNGLPRVVKEQSFRTKWRHFSASTWVLLAKARSWPIYMAG